MIFHCDPAMLLLVKLFWDRMCALRHHQRNPRGRSKRITLHFVNTKPIIAEIVTALKAFICWVSLVIYRI